MLGCSFSTPDERQIKSRAFDCSLHFALPTVARAHRASCTQTDCVDDTQLCAFTINVMIRVRAARFSAAARQSI